MKNKKTLTLVIITLILLISIVFLASTLLFSGSKKSLAVETALPESGNQVKPNTTTELGDIKIELADYRVFKIDGIPFNFVIAKIRVNAPSATNISLDHFVTSESVKLNEVNDYINKLEAKSYFLGKQNVVYDLISNDTTYFANIFIPVLSKASKAVEVKVDFNDQTLKFDLDSHIGDISLLSYKADDIITDGKTYQMKVSSAFEITGEYMSQNNTEYYLPSTVKVYAFKLETVSLWGDTITIENAQYVTEKNDVFEALDSSIQAMKFENMIGKKIKDKDTGTLFFVAFNPIDNPITYNGVLKLKVSGSDTWISINVKLN